MVGKGDRVVVPAAAVSSMMALARATMAMTNSRIMTSHCEKNRANRTDKKKETTLDAENPGPK